MKVKTTIKEPQEQVIPLPPESKPRFTWQEVEPAEEPTPTPSFSFHSFAAGENSQKLLNDVEALIAARDEHAAKAQELEAKVKALRAELEDKQALALIGQVAEADVKSARKALAKLQGDLETCASIVAGTERQLPGLLEELAEAQKSDLEAALEENGKGLEEARAAFLEALEPGAAALVEAVRPLVEEWRGLLETRYILFRQEGNVTGDRPDSAGRKMRADPLCRLFGEDYDQAGVLDLLEILLPLLSVGPSGWPRVRGRPHVRGLSEQRGSW